MSVFTLCGGVSFLLNACSSIPRISVGGIGEFDEGLKIQSSAFAESDKVLVNFSLLEAPILVQKKADGKYNAIYLLCTHKACEVSVHKYSLDCPCHGSQFDLDGNVLEGPAEEKLKSFPVEEDGNGNLIIKLN